MPTINTTPCGAYDAFLEGMCLDETGNGVVDSPLLEKVLLGSDQVSGLVQAILGAPKAHLDYYKRQRVLTPDQLLALEQRLRLEAIDVFLLEQIATKQVSADVLECIRDRKSGTFIGPERIATLLASENVKTSTSALEIAA